MKITIKDLELELTKMNIKALKVYKQTFSSDLFEDISIFENNANSTKSIEILGNILYVASKTKQKDLELETFLNNFDELDFADISNLTPAITFFVSGVVATVKSEAKK